MPTFSWTQYPFNSTQVPLSVEAYEAFRASPASEHEALIESIRTKRWENFRKDQQLFMWCLALCPVGVLALAAAPDSSTIRGIAALVVILTFLPCISLFISACSHANAMSKQCEHLRREFSTAATATTYADYMSSRSRR